MREIYKEVAIKNCQRINGDIYKIHVLYLEVFGIQLIIFTSYMTMDKFLNMGPIFHTFRKKNTKETPPHTNL